MGTFIQACLEAILLYLGTTSGEKEAFKGTDTSSILISFSCSAAVKNHSLGLVLDLLL